MSKYFKNLGNTHEPLQLDESTAINEQMNTLREEQISIGKELQKMREKKGWSKEELGSKVGIDGEQVALFEKGEQPVPEVLAKDFGEIFENDFHIFLTA